MVWEMRDLNTFRLALRAAETWNLVFATLHTSGAARTVSRIIDMFPSSEKDQVKAQLSESLIWVVWQKLLQTKDWKGRVLAAEVMSNNTSISNIIRKGEVHQINSVIETSAKEWMINMRRTLDELYESDKITEDLYNEELSLLWKDL
jgi:twitching motility protein PilT